MRERIHISRRDGLKGIAAASALLGGAAFGISNVTSQEAEADIELMPECEALAHVTNNLGVPVTLTAENENGETQTHQIGADTGEEGMDIEVAAGTYTLTGTRDDTGDRVTIAIIDEATESVAEQGETVTVEIEPCPTALRVTERECALRLRNRSEDFDIEATVSGPNGYSRNDISIPAGEQTTLENLEQGSYTVTASSGDPDGTVIEGEDSATASFFVRCGDEEPTVVRVGSEGRAIALHNRSDQHSASVTITGPEDFSFSGSLAAGEQRTVDVPADGTYHVTIESENDHGTVIEGEGSNQTDVSIGNEEEEEGPQTDADITVTPECEALAHITNTLGEAITLTAEDQNGEAQTYQISADTGAEGMDIEITPGTYTLTGVRTGDGTAVTIAIIDEATESVAVEGESVTVTIEPCPTALRVTELECALRLRNRGEDFDLSVDVSGPNGYSRNDISIPAGEQTTLENLEQGSYTVTASSDDPDGTVIEGEDSATASFFVRCGDEEPTVVQVGNEGRTIELRNRNDQHPASATITGPDGFSRNLTLGPGERTTVDVPTEGTYRVTIESENPHGTVIEGEGSNETELVVGAGDDGDGVDDGGGDGDGNGDGDHDHDHDHDDKKKKKKPDIENDVSLKGICKKKNKKKGGFRIHNDTDHDLRMTWKTEDGTKRGTVTVSANSSTDFWVDLNGDWKTKVFICHGGETIDSASVGQTSWC